MTRDCFFLRFFEVCILQQVVSLSRLLYSQHSFSVSYSRGRVFITFLGDLGRRLGGIPMIGYFIHYCCLMEQYF
jgi:hypothetical protein